jgi:Domain of unknown function (DUF4232)
MHIPTLSPKRLAVGVGLACAAALIPVASLGATASAAGTPACATSGLVVWANATYGGGYAGGYIYTVSFTNLSGHACTLRGYPGVSAVSLTGRQLGRPAGWGTATPRLVWLANGATATAQLNIGDAANFANCGPVTAAGLRVYPPNQTASKVVPIPIGACSHAGPVWMSVQPVQR